MLPLLGNDHAGRHVEQRRYLLAVDEEAARGDVLLPKGRVLLGPGQNAARHDEGDHAAVGQVAVGAKGEEQRRQFHVRKQVRLPPREQLMPENQFAHAFLIIGSLDVAVGEPRWVADDEGELLAREHGRLVSVPKDETPYAVRGGRLQEPAHQGQVRAPQMALAVGNAEGLKPPAQSFQRVGVVVGWGGVPDQGGDRLPQLLGPVGQLQRQVESGRQVARFRLAGARRQGIHIDGEGMTFSSSAGCSDDSVSAM